MSRPTNCCCLLIVLTVLGSGIALAAPEPAKTGPTAAQRRDLQTQLDALSRQIDTLRDGKSTPVDRQHLTDVVVCAKAVEWALRHNDFPKPDDVKKAFAVVKLGRERADALSSNSVNWDSQPGTVSLGYVSEIDGSVQPYSLSFPKEYSTAGAKRWPVTIVLHGRNGSLTEVNFVADHDRSINEKAKSASGQNDIRLEVYGRGNNAYRWSGETDVFEALNDARRRIRIDDRRVVLWGFSMGGAGAWHLGVHHPDSWAAVGAGAGFVDYYGYQKKSEPLPDYQDATLTIYDTVNYALNLSNVPFVTYGGELDSQLLASKTMQAAATEVDAPLEFVLGKQIGHKFTPEGEKEFQAFLAINREAGRPLPTQRDKVRFITFTPKYNHCGWVTVAEMSDLYTPAVVEAEKLDDDTARVTTLNVAALQLTRDVAEEVEIDGDRLPLRDAAGGFLSDVTFVRTGEHWRLLDYDATREFSGNPDLHKRHNLQGPIDDAFMQPFVCVKGTGQPWNAKHQAYVDWSASRFENEFDKYLRGRVPTVSADAVTPELIAENNLILWGDPGSNPLIARLLPELPITWEQDKITVGDESFDTGKHAVALIFPNPLNHNRYVVLNSGHTFHADAFTGTNALLYPRLGDIAVLKFATNSGPNGSQTFTENTAWAAIFDTDWKLPAKD